MIMALPVQTAVFQRRSRGVLGISELNELMLECQAEAYGDGVDPEHQHPYMWVLKPHYYGSHFYNWPYTFGLLFGLGLCCWMDPRYGDETLSIPVGGERHLPVVPRRARALDVGIDDA